PPRPPGASTDQPGPPLSAGESPVNDFDFQYRHVPPLVRVWGPLGSCATGFALGDLSTGGPSPSTDSRGRHLIQRGLRQARVQMSGGRPVPVGETGRAAVAARAGRP